jgi:CRP/FNR family cyclic AMP-dependent transcriptional regulator
VTTDPLFARFGRELPAGDTLCHAGDAGAEMYVIQSGVIEIVKRVGNEEHRLALLEHGEFLGEMALLNGKPRTATARVLETSRCLVLDGHTLETLLAKSPEIALRLMKKLAARLDAADEWIRILMNPDPRARILLTLKRHADEQAAASAARGETTAGQGGRSIAVHTRADVLARETGATLEEVERVLLRLERLRIARRRGEDVITVADVTRLLDFLEFLEAPERFGA